MSITSSDKIFINVDDEINFVIEKILNSEKERVILIIPQNALVVSSQVSMRILSKQLMKSKKQLILVTEDSFGEKLAKTAGLIATNKVSNVAPEMWESAQLAKEKAKEQADAVKKELLTKRGAISESADLPVERVAEDTDVPEITLESESDLGAEAGEEVAETTELPVAEAEEETSQPEIAEDDKISEQNPAPAAEDLPVRGPIQRSRRQPKLVEVGGFKIYAGGDIGEIADQNTNIMDEDDTSVNSVAAPVDRLERAKQASKAGSSSFTGRDWTNYTADPKPSFKFPKLWNRDPDAPIREPNEDDKRKKKIIIGGGVVGGVLLLLLGGYVIASQLSAVDVKITLKTAEVPVEQQITADMAVTEVDTETLVIPAQVITEEGLSISASDTSTGEGASGNLAAGVIDLWNKTTQEVKIAAGTVVENTTTNLKYVIKAEVTVPAAQTSGGPINDIGEVRDVRIEAQTFGEEYNITESGTKVDFKVGDLTTDQVIGKRFRNIEGGTKKTFKAPSQADVDKVKAKLAEDLQRQGQNKLNNLVPDGFKLLEGTAKFEEVTVRSTPEVGKEGTSFSVTLEGKATAMIVSEEDLEEAIVALIAKNNTDTDPDTQFEIKNAGDVEISNVVRTEGKATFVIVSRGSLQSSVKAEDVQNMIRGKGLDEAEELLIKVSEIQNVSVTYTPTFVPEFMKRVPNDNSRIKVVFE